MFYLSYINLNFPKEGASSQRIIPQQEQFSELFDKLWKEHGLHMLGLLAQNLIKLGMSVNYSRGMHFECSMLWWGIKETIVANSIYLVRPPIYDGS